jgi:hypothetical protein
VQTVPISFTRSRRDKEYTFTFRRPAAKRFKTTTANRAWLRSKTAPRASPLYRGEPRWEYKFLPRAVEQEPSLKIASLPHLRQ